MYLSDDTYIELTHMWILYKEITYVYRKAYMTVVNPRQV